jgi:chaperonin GroES
MYGDLVAVKRIENKMSDIIFVIGPEKSDIGEVLYAGPGAKDKNGNRLPMNVKVGDKVVFGQWIGQPMRMDGKEVFVMHEKDIMAVV